MAEAKPPERRKPTAEVFDKAFTAAANSPWLRDAFGTDLPSEIDPFSFVTLDGLQTLIEELELRAGKTLVDMACGRGGPGLWLAKSTGVNLIGVDWSRVGIDHAAQRAQGAAGVNARYVVADAAKTGLDDECADAVVCIDAIQLMLDPEAVAKEIRRLLRVGGRAGCTTWEPEDESGKWSRILTVAGLTVLSDQHHQEWKDREIRIFERAVREKGTVDDAGLANLAEEAERALPELAKDRRVILVAER